MGTVRTRILRPGSVPDQALRYVVMMAMYEGQGVWVMHRDRNTWEMPAGHIESGENPDQAASRELNEETGAIRSSLKVLCDYSVEMDGSTARGRFYLAEIHEKEEALRYETNRLLFSNELPASLTYPQVQKVLFHYGRKALLLQQRAKG